MLIFGSKNYYYYYFYLLKKYIQVPWTYQKVSFVYSKGPLLNKMFRQKSAQIRRVKTCIKLKLESLVETLRKSQSLEQNLKKNCSNCNRIWMFLEYLIPKRMFDIFQLFFKEVHLTTLNKLN